MSTAVKRPGDHRADDLFFAGMEVLILASVFLGFARSYFLAGVFRAPLPNALIHANGAVFSSWIILLIVQTSWYRRVASTYTGSWECSGEHWLLR
jgi:hypothetical protein